MQGWETAPWKSNATWLNRKGTEMKNKEKSARSQGRTARPRKPGKTHPYRGYVIDPMSGRLIEIENYEPEGRRKPSRSPFLI